MPAPAPNLVGGKGKGGRSPGSGGTFGTASTQARSAVFDDLCPRSGAEGPAACGLRPAHSLHGARATSARTLCGVDRQRPSPVWRIKGGGRLRRIHARSSCPSPESKQINVVLVQLRHHLCA
jgi:hypothetical protein